MLEEILEKVEEIISLLEESPLNEDLFVIDELAHQLQDEVNRLID